MISIIFEFLTRGLIWIIKCIFDMILFFLRQLFRLLRLFLVLLPATAIVYSCFFLILIIEIFAGENVISSLFPIHIDSTEVKELITGTLTGYISLLSEYSGTLMYFLLFLIMLILAVPLFLTFVGVGTFVYVGKILTVPLLIDAGLYLVRCIVAGKTPFDIISSRYRVLFPRSGRKLNERSYNRWLSRHHDDFENDTFGKKTQRSPLDEFYADEYDDEAPDYDEDYDEDYDDYYDEDNEYGYDEDSEYEYDENYLEDNYYEDDSRKEHPRKSTDIENFNFFAGCSSLESATKKYKTLVKLYHPDNMDGDTSALQEINVQYQEIKKRLS